MSGRAIALNGDMRDSTVETFAVFTDSYDDGGAHLTTPPFIGMVGIVNKISRKVVRRGRKLRQNMQHLSRRAHSTVVFAPL